MITGRLLQMPSIVTLCQALLTTSSFSPTGPSTTSNLLTSPHLRPYEGSSSRPLGAGFSQGGMILPQALTAWQNLARFVPIKERPFPSVQPTLIRPTPTRPANTCQQQDSTHLTADSIPPTGPPSLVHVDKYGFCPPLKPHEGLNQTLETMCRSEKRDEESVRVAGDSSVVLDIAACDGPVFFERIVNRAFKAQHNEEDGANSSDSDDSEINVVDTGTNNDSYTRGTFSSLKKQPPTPPTPSSGGGSRTYHCVYCNNNFKSHYCYQKHMRRHINPITVEEAQSVVSEVSDPNGGTSAIYGVEKKDSKPFRDNKTMETLPPVPSTSTRENDQPLNEDSGAESHHSSGSADGGSTGRLRVLDLNVQYFPCKTCSSKFPSYYFVHKHRRLCHRDEEEEGELERCAKSNAPTPTSSSCGSPLACAPTHHLKRGETQSSSDTN